MRRNIEITHAMHRVIAGLATGAMLMAGVPALAQTAPARTDVSRGQSGFTGGVRVAAGDVNGDGADDNQTGDGTEDIITGAGPGGGPHNQAPGADDLAAEQEQQEVGLLLPAVQKVREAANRAPESGADDLKAPEEEGEAALLLPAVQSAREAAR